jgi:hypothetical protein
MNPYLAKLRARDEEKRHPQEPSKPSEPIVPVVTGRNTTAERGFEGFEGDQDRCFSGNKARIEKTSLDRLHRPLERLQSRCPDFIPHDRWHEAIQDSRRFLTQWGAQAEVLGWTARDLLAWRPYPTSRARPIDDSLARVKLA